MAVQLCTPIVFSLFAYLSFVSFFLQATLLQRCRQCCGTRVMRGLKKCRWTRTRCMSTSWQNRTRQSGAQQTTCATAGAVHQSTECRKLRSACNLGQIGSDITQTTTKLYRLHHASKTTDLIILLRTQTRTCLCFTGFTVAVTW